MVGRDHNYEYNGKEFEESLGYDMHEYEARHYDAATSRFVTVDPKAEQYNSQSVYVYAADNPVFFIDKNGEGPEGCCDGMDLKVDRITATERVIDNGGSIEEYRHALNLYQGDPNAKPLTWNDVKSWVASGVDFIPLIGDGKGFIEFFTGSDLVSGDKLSWGDRALGLFLLSEFRTAGKVADAVGTAKTTKTIKTRKTKGGDGATSKHIIEKDANGNTISKTHQVTDKDGKVIHQHQDHVSTQKNPETNKHNTRQFPDEWVEYPKIDN